MIYHNRFFVEILYFFLFIKVHDIHKSFCVHKSHKSSRNFSPFSSPFVLFLSRQIADMRDLFVWTMSFSILLPTFPDSQNWIKTAAILAEEGIESNPSFTSKCTFFLLFFQSFHRFLKCFLFYTAILNESFFTPIHWRERKM